jgi:hypothetical protein
MKRFAAVLVVAAAISGVAPAAATAASLGGGDCGSKGPWPLTLLLVPYC